jgi:hypothetical protein
MHLPKASNVVAATSLLFRIVVSDDALANLQLLGAEADCFDFNLDGSLFSATCVSVEGFPTFASIDLDHCIANDNGNMIHQVE